MIRTTLAVSLLAFLALPIQAGPIGLPDGRALERIDFDRHVHALLDRQGCNAGACHGNRHGKGGFSLSLMAESPAKDHAEIARSRFGRHVNVADPERSLLLQKATGQLKHEGGIRILPRSWEYQVLRQWIADGAEREPQRGQITALHVVPAEHIFQPGEKLQLKVIAHFADGAKEDVTCFSDFRIPEPMIAPPKEEPEPLSVSRTGEVHAVTFGDVGIVVIYRGNARVMRARVAAPLAKDFVYPNVPATNFIDRKVFGDLRRLNLVPSELCSDEHFLRRVYVDVIGTTPAPAEIRAFLACQDSDKRTKKIDELLAHPRHAALLALRLCEMTDLIGGFHDTAMAPRAKAAQMAHDWFRKRLHDNMPYDRIVEGVLTATSKEGRNFKTWYKEKLALESAETGFGTAYASRLTLDHFWRNDGLALQPDPIFGDTHPRKSAAPIESLAERTVAAFLGIQLECARCHVHPLDAWTPADHQAFSNVFAQVGLDHESLNKRLPFHQQHAERARVAVRREVFLGAPANLRLHPDTGAVLKPRLLGGPEIDFHGDARQTLMRWLARPDNPFFARHFVHGLWEHYFGVSLVESTDSYASAFTPENTTLLNLLAKDFIARRFDIRRLERTILLSRTYQLSAAVHESNKFDRTNFSHVVLRRMHPRVAADVLHTALETRENFGPGVPAGLSPVEVMHPGHVTNELSRSDAYKERIDRILRLFGRTELVARCDGENSIRSYLHAYGSPEINALFRNSKRVQRLAKSTQPLDEIIDECFLATLSRLPSAEHRKLCTELLQREPKMRQNSVENIFWALVNTKEFATRH